MSEFNNAHLWEDEDLDEAEPLQTFGLGYLVTHNEDVFAEVVAAIESKGRVNVTISKRGGELVIVRTPEAVAKEHPAHRPVQ